MRSAHTALTQAIWTKSSYSRENGCVEVAGALGVTGVRDSKLGDTSPVIAVHSAAFGAFISAAKQGRFDHH